MRIGQLAKLTDETVKTLRYWTDHGLLEAERSENGYRHYNGDAVQRVAFIRSAQEFGFTLSEIRDILSLQASGVKPCEHVRAGLESHLETVRSRIVELEALEKDLEARLAWAEAHPKVECQVDGCVYLIAGSDIEHPVVNASR